MTAKADLRLQKHLLILFATIHVCI